MPGLCTKIQFPPRVRELQFLLGRPFLESAVRSRSLKNLCEWVQRAAYLADLGTSCETSLNLRLPNPNLFYHWRSLTANFLCSDLEGVGLSLDISNPFRRSRSWHASASTSSTELYQQKVVPFGTRNAPAIFHRMVDLVLVRLDKPLLRTVEYDVG